MSLGTGSATCRVSLTMIPGVCAVAHLEAVLELFEIGKLPFTFALLDRLLFGFGTFALGTNKSPEAINDTSAILQRQLR